MNGGRRRKPRDWLRRQTAKRQAQAGAALAPEKPHLMTLTRPETGVSASMLQQAAPFAQHPGQFAEQSEQYLYGQEQQWAYGQEQWMHGQEPWGENEQYVQQRLFMAQQTSM